jgi:hypothetical protein
LHDFVEDFMATPEGMVNDGTWDAKGEILKPEGKIEDPSQPGVFSQIILILSPQWQIQFWMGSGYTRIFGAKIVGGIADEPMKATGAAGDITVLESPVDGLVVASGSGLDVGQASQLAEVHGQIQRSIFIDTELVSNGNGYQQTPYNNWSDAVDDAELNNIRSLVVLADATVDRLLKNFTVLGVGRPAIDFNGQDVDKSEFQGCQLTGAMLGSVHARSCSLVGVTGINGHFVACDMQGALEIAADGDVVFDSDPHSQVAGLGRPTFSMNASSTGAKLGVRGYSGGLTLTNCNHVNDEVTLEFAQGKCTLDATCTLGSISVRGVAQFTNNAAGSAVDSSGLVDDIIFARFIEAGLDFEEAMRLVAAHAAGSIVQQPDGSYVIRDINDTKDRISGDAAAEGGRTITATDAT